MRSVLLYFLLILWVVMVSLPATGAQNQITFWTMEMEQDRLEIQRNIAHAFTKKTGIYVRVVPVQENLLAERVAAANAVGSLPDVIFHPIAFTIRWAASSRSSLTRWTAEKSSITTPSRLVSGTRLRFTPRTAG